MLQRATTAFVPFFLPRKIADCLYILKKHDMSSCIAVSDTAYRIVCRYMFICLFLFTFLPHCAVMMGENKFANMFLYSRHTFLQTPFTLERFTSSEDVCGVIVLDALKKFLEYETYLTILIFDDLDRS